MKTNSGKKIDPWLVNFFVGWTVLAPCCAILLLLLIPDAAKEWFIEILTNQLPTLHIASSVSNQRASAALLWITLVIFTPIQIFKLMRTSRQYGIDDRMAVARLRLKKRSLRLCIQYLITEIIVIAAQVNILFNYLPSEMPNSGWPFFFNGMFAALVVIPVMNLCVVAIFMVFIISLGKRNDN